MRISIGLVLLLVPHVVMPMSFDFLQNIVTNVEAAKLAEQALKSAVANNNMQEALQAQAQIGELGTLLWTAVDTFKKTNNGKVWQEELGSPKIQELYQELEDLKVTTSSLEKKVIPSEEKIIRIVKAYNGALNELIEAQNIGKALSILKLTDLIHQFQLLLTAEIDRAKRLQISNFQNTSFEADINSLPSDAQEKRKKITELKLQTEKLLSDAVNRNSSKDILIAQDALNKLNALWQDEVKKVKVETPSAKLNENSQKVTEAIRQLKGN